MAALAVKFNSVYWRTPSYNFVRYAITVASALVMGSIYYKAGGWRVDIEV